MKAKSLQIGYASSWRSRPRHPRAKPGLVLSYQPSSCKSIKAFILPKYFPPSSASKMGRITVASFLTNLARHFSPQGRLPYNPMVREALRLCTVRFLPHMEVPRAIRLCSTTWRSPKHVDCTTTQSPSLRWNMYSGARRGRTCYNTNSNLDLDLGHGSRHRTTCILPPRCSLSPPERSGKRSEGQGKNPGSHSFAFSSRLAVRP